MNEELIMKKVFLENLPKKIYKGRKCIDWINSVGYKVPFIYEDIKGEVEIVDYDKNKTLLTIKYNNKKCKISTGSFTSCSFGNISNKITSDFKIEIGTTFKDDKRDLIITNRRHIKNKRGQYKKYYKYKCNKCGFECSRHWNIKDKCYKDELWIEESKIINGVGCSCCVNQIVVKNINSIIDTHPHLVKYFVNIEDAYTHTIKSNHGILLKCPDCGFEKMMKTNNFFYKGFSCPQCSDGISYPEKFMYNLLQQLKENNLINNFIYQYTKKHSNWCNKYKYDFYFKYNNEEYIVETHGMQHYVQNGWNIIEDRNSLKEIQQNDKNKKELALNNGIKPKNYIVIDCRYSEINFIKNNILSSRLNEIFDLDVIDWIKIGQESEKNLVKEVCDYWKLHNNINNEGLSIKDLTKIFNASKSMLLKYLHIGLKLNWCNYNGENEKIKNYINFKTINGKKIEVFKNNKSLGVFPSCSELERKSEKLFGVKLLKNKISEVANGKRKQYKGYIFSYII